MRVILVGGFEQDAEFVAADPGDDVAVTDALGQQVGDLDQRLVAGAMAERIVDHLQAVEIDEQHRRVDPVAVDPRDQPLELAHEAAPVRELDQRVLVRQLVELLDPRLKLGNLTAQPADLLDQPLRVRNVSYLIGHCPRACPQLIGLAIA